jgi:hypothetical protein
MMMITTGTTTITIPSMNAAAKRGQKPARGPEGPLGGPYCVGGGG